MSYVLMWMGGGSLRGLTIKKELQATNDGWEENWALSGIVQCTVVNLETIDTSTKMNSTGCNYIYMYTHIDVHVCACVCM